MKFILISLGFFLVSCQHTKTDKDLQPSYVNAPVICDTSQVISYSRDIIPIISSNCYSCHSGKAATAGLDMSNYETLKALALNDGHYLINTVNGNPDYVYMPPSPARKLTSCEIAKINKWTYEGANNN